MKIFISVPQTGYNKDKQRGKALCFSKYIDALGHDPVIQQEPPAPENEHSELDKYAHNVGEGVKQLLACNGAYFDRGWQNCPECRVQHAVAATLGYPIFYSLAKLEDAE